MGKNVGLPYLYALKMHTKKMIKFRSIKGKEMSFAEKIIFDKLNYYCVNFFQEVTFDGCINPLTGMSLKYDFYLPLHNVLIEYDGIEAHSSKEAKERDRIKNKFAKDNGIKLYRISGLQYIDHCLIERIKLRKNEQLRPKALKSEFNDNLHASKKKQINRGKNKKKWEARRNKKKNK